MMDLIYFLDIYFLIGVLAVFFLNSAELTLAKLKPFCEENEISTKGFLFKSAIDFSLNFRNYSITFVLARYSLIFALAIILSRISDLNSLLSIFNFTNYFIIDNFDNFNFALNFLIVLPFFVFFVYLLPRFIFSNGSVRFSLFSIYPILLLHYVFSPFRLLIYGMSKFVEILSSKSPDTSHLNSEEELRNLIDESTKAGNIEENESKLIDNIFEFKETVARQVMTPRSKIVSVGTDWNFGDIMDTVKNEGYSRYPVFKDNIDSIFGILHTKDMFGLSFADLEVIPESIVRSTIFVKEEDYIDDLLREFQKKKIQMAIVTDDFGGTSGIITMEDILEEIVGEINDEHDEIIKEIDKIDQNTYIVDAAVQIRDLNDVLPELLPESDDYESLGGLITTETGIIPEVNFSIKIGNYNFQILRRTMTKIEKVKIIYSDSSSSDK